MLPLVAWPEQDRKQILGVFTDIDDTLTTEGAITDDALVALSKLKEAGLHVVAITGRPVGWSLPFARSWPVDAIVAENGAVALVRQMAHSPHGQVPIGVQQLYQQEEATRRGNFSRMQQVVARILREVPGSSMAQDSHGRETDIAIDHSEFSHLTKSQIAQVVAIMRSEGMSATVSSIHVNGWYGAHNKLEGARWIVRELFGRMLDTERQNWAFVGDSTNDQLMFDAFANSIGVANVRRFLPELSHLPRFVSRSERGAGFSEVVA
ncbi:MAG: HAD-IIB family hydrolase, partial [Betaproteobacteria bacterium]